MRRFVLLLVLPAALGCGTGGSPAATGAFAKAEAAWKSESLKLETLEKEYAQKRETLKKEEAAIEEENAREAEALRESQKSGEKRKEYEERADVVYAKGASREVLLTDYASIDRKELKLAGLKKLLRVTDLVIEIEGHYKPLIAEQKQRVESAYIAKEAARR